VQSINDFYYFNEDINRVIHSFVGNSIEG